MSENEMQNAIDEITRRYQPQLDALQSRGQALADDVEKPSAGGAMIGADLQIDWKEVELIFDLPAVTMKNRKVSLDLPEMTFTKHRISFDVPETRMVAKKIGQYPQVHGPRIKWKDIITHVPEIVMKRREIVTDMPRITMKRKELVVPVPEFSMKRQRWVTKLPQFKVVNVRAETEAMQKAGSQLQAEADRISTAMQGELEAVVGSFGSGFGADLFGKRAEIAASFDDAIAQIQSTIASLQAQGCDPVKVPSDDGDINLRKLLADLVEQREQALAQFGESTEPALAMAA